MVFSHTNFTASTCCETSSSATWWWRQMRSQAEKQEQRKLICPIRSVSLSPMEIMVCWNELLQVHAWLSAPRSERRGKASLHWSQGDEGQYGRVQSASSWFSFNHAERAQSVARALERLKRGLGWEEAREGMGGPKGCRWRNELKSVSFATETLFLSLFFFFFSPTSSLQPSNAIARSSLPNSFCTVSTHTNYTCGFSVNFAGKSPAA